MFGEIINKHWRDKTEKQDKICNNRNNVGNFGHLGRFYYIRKIW
jgi:hypothetical protein